MSSKFITFDYAAKTEELEGVLAHLQAEDVSLDKALQLHTTGKALTAELEEYLQHAENEVKKQLAKAQ
jgi:exodeoxyribonuclease VII small subunit